MSKLYDQRTTVQHGLESRNYTRLQKMGKSLNTHPGWIANQAIQFALDQPDKLFEYLRGKVRTI